MLKDGLIIAFGVGNMATSKESKGSGAAEALEAHRALMIEKLGQHQPLDNCGKHMLGVESYGQLDTRILAGMIYDEVERKIIGEYDQRKADLPDDVASMLSAVRKWKWRDT